MDGLEAKLDGEVGTDRQLEVAVSTCGIGDVPDYLTILKPRAKLWVQTKLTGVYQFRRNGNA